MHCSFEPVVQAGHAGSGLHFHFSPMRDGEHRGRMDDRDTLTEEARWLIGALVRSGGALMAFGNRQAESFVRLRQGKEAPAGITWGRFNRRALVRLPIQVCDGEGRAVTPPTIEFRLPDGSVHPHLLLAGVAQAYAAEPGSPDLEALLNATRASQVAAGEGEAQSVPREFGEVAARLQVCRTALEAGGVFPPALIDAALDHLRGA
jgi:glutamine synthetase